MQGLSAAAINFTAPVLDVVEAAAFVSAKPTIGTSPSRDEAVRSATVGVRGSHGPASTALDPFAVLASREPCAVVGAYGMPYRNAGRVRAYCSQLFQAAGLAADRANLASDAVVKADLLGFHTHGIRRVPCNVEWFLDGTTRAHGEPITLRDTAASLTRDADPLPGPWVLVRALEEVIVRSTTQPVAAIAVGRSQHVACLAAALEPQDSHRIFVTPRRLTPARDPLIAYCNRSRSIRGKEIVQGQHDGVEATLQAGRRSPWLASRTHSRAARVGAAA